MPTATNSFANKENAPAPSLGLYVQVYDVIKTLNRNAFNEKRQDEGVAFKQSETLQVHSTGSRCVR